MFQGHEDAIFQKKRKKGVPFHYVNYKYIFIVVLQLLLNQKYLYITLKIYRNEE